MVKYSTQIKGVLRELVEKGLTQKEIANELDVSRSTIRQWLKKEKLKTKGNQPRFTCNYCEECDAPIVAVNQYAVYCSDECSQRVRNRKAREEATSVCKECGVMFKAWNHFYCEDCKRQLAEQQMIIEKQREKQIMINKFKRKLWWLINSKQEEQMRIKRLTKKCSHCKKTFVANHGSKKYCSDECLNEVSLQRRRRRYSLDERNRHYRAKRNGKIDWSISLKRLIKRDDNVCHLCEEECDINDYQITEEEYFIAGNDYPSIDHVVPISKGGTHTWDNVKLSHRLCNSIKSNK